MVRVKKRLGKILIEAGLITEEQLQKALESRDNKSLARTLVDLGYVTEGDIAKTLAQRMHLPFINLEDYKINPNAATIISEEVAQRYLVFPIDFEGDRLVVAMADPANVFAIDDLRIVTGYDVKPVVSTESGILSAIHQYARIDKTIEQVAETVAAESEVREALTEEREAEEAPVVKLVDLIITEAVRERANDIHIEPQEKDLRIRYRIDGVLHEVMRSPKGIQPGLVSRIKIMAGMDIAERRIPQDGRFGLTLDKKSIDFRVATLPTIHGEKIVLRLLEKESILMDLNDLGMLPESLERFKSSFTKPYGTILVTGPTGCGKTTTLYAVLNVLNSPEKNIITVEDPVEYRLPGINQVQVNPKAGLTFATGLRSILRNDPDIVMIGEIRDVETAMIAIESALTGHLVLSTLHTNDAPSSLTRLTEMGVEPFLTSSAVDCIVAQRLARRLCSHCKEPYTPDPKILRDVGFPLNGDKGVPTLYRPGGCGKCDGTGYKGRIGVFEVMLVNETIERLTVEKASAEEIRRVAIAEGMKTLRQDGFEKVRLGITSIEEIIRVIV
ncbi:MAG: ATPase, T2SS/T4P/T4SS family [Actinomycetota bacterium]